MKKNKTLDEIKKETAVLFKKIDKGKRVLSKRKINLMMEEFDDLVNLYFKTKWTVQFTMARYQYVMSIKIADRLDDNYSPKDLGYFNKDCLIRALLMHNLRDEAMEIMYYKD